MLLTIERKQQTEKLVPRVIEVSLNKGEKGLGISIAGGKGNQHIPDSDGMLVLSYCYTYHLKLSII